MSSVAFIDGVSKLVLQTAIGAASHGSASYLLNSPIRSNIATYLGSYSNLIDNPIRPRIATHVGALQGFFYVASKLCIYKVFHLKENDRNRTDAKVIAFVLSVLASYGLTWVVLAEVGITFALLDLVVLAGVSYLTKIAIDAVLDTIKASQ